MEVGVHIIVRGVVQGVGFRFFVHRVARELNLRGYVRNLYDGSVEIEAEGERGLIEELIKRVKVGPPLSSVRDLKIEWKKYQNKYNSFEIRF